MWKGTSTHNVNVPAIVNCKYSSRLKLSIWPVIEHLTGIYYAKPDGSSIQEMAFPRANPNGIVLSPDEQRLYISETWTRKIVYYELSGPGQIVPNPNTIMDTSYLLTAAIPSQAVDSIRIDEEGNVYVVSFCARRALI